jgi:hypothetical protein
MTEEQQRIAIAEACGWVFPKGNGANGPFVIRPNGDHLWHNDNPVGVERALLWNYIPEYTRDLNAMHEAVRKLTDSQRAEFRRSLTEVWTTWYNATRGSFPNHDDSVNAPADQRAEAFLRALNL